MSDKASGTGLERLPKDASSTADLIAIALSDLEREKAEGDQFAHDGQSALSVLHARGNREVLDAAFRLCDSRSPLERQLGAQILGKLGPHRPFREECCDRLVDLLSKAEDEDVRLQAFYSLGHLGNRRADKTVAAFAGDPKPEIRRAVAFALCGTTDPDAVRALLALMREPEADTRDWATTAIGQETSVDGPEIRAALMERTQDEDTITRAEALHGLARRQDRKALPLLIAELRRRSHQDDDREDQYLDYLFREAAGTFLAWAGEQVEDVDIATLIAALRKLEMPASRN